MQRTRSKRYSDAVGLLLFFTFLCLVMPTSDVPGQTIDNPERTSPVPELSLEELMQVKVTSVSKKPEPWFDAASAVYVITSEDIRRSGVTSFADALRLAPGLDVARVQSDGWAIGSRGFTEQGENKLLALVDGRTIYSPLFAGVLWQMQDYMLEDIDRIEVIRGPGGTLWGANAVNGVINIVTKSAKDTQGWYAEGGGGTFEEGFGSVRYGGKVGDSGYFRVYGTGFNRDAAVLSDGSSAEDSWQLGQGGFRMDWDATDKNLYTLQGDVVGTPQHGMLAFPTIAPVGTTTTDVDRVYIGANILGRWTHQFADGSDFKLQTYYDYIYDGLNMPSRLLHKAETFDVEFDHRFALGDRQQIVWGGGYRVVHDEVDQTQAVQVVLDTQTLQLFNMFVQDEITLVKDRLRLTLGSKLEHNDFTGLEVEPSARVLWTPTQRQTTWAAVSRGVRTPSIFEEDLRVIVASSAGSPDPAFPDATAVEVGKFGEDIKSENLLAYELGYRVQPADWLSLDVATFYNVYDHLVSVEPGTPFGESSFGSNHLVVPLEYGNRLNGESYGVEAAAYWQATEWWRLSGSYSFLTIEIHPDGSQDTVSEHAFEGNDPHHQFRLHSSMDLTKQVQLDCTARYVDNLPNKGVPSYAEMDVRLAWRPSRNWEVAVVGQNLLHERHPEFTPTLFSFQPSEVPRSVYAKVTWRY